MHFRHSCTEYESEDLEVRRHLVKLRNGKIIVVIGAWLKATEAYTKRSGGRKGQIKQMSYIQRILIPRVIVTALYTVML